MTAFIFLAGAVLLCSAVRLWRGLPLAVLAGYLLLVFAYFAVPLCTSAFQVPTDIAYQWPPWSGEVEGPVSPRNPLLADVPLQMLPFHALARERLLAGRLPLWAGELGTGQPLLGNAQSAPFAPLHVMALPLPPLCALTVAAAWQVLLALLLMHALAAALGAGSPGAAFAAIAYAFSVFAVCWAYHPHGMAMAWIPGVLLGLVLLRRGEAGGLSGVVGCGLGLLLSGHPETAAHGVLAALVAALILGARRAGVPRRVFFGKVALAGVLAGCLAAPALLPVLDAIPESLRQAVVDRRPDLVQPPPFESRTLALAVDPLRFGSPRDGTWNGPFNFNELASGYAGLLALAAACAGALARPRRLLPLLLGGVLALLVALRVEPFFSLMTLVPVLGRTPHARLRLLYVLAVALAGGLGLDLVARRAGRRLAVGCTLTLSAALLALPPPAPRSPWEQAWLVVALAGAGAWAAALLLVRRPGGVRNPGQALDPPPVLDAHRLQWLAVAALLADLVVLTVRYQPVVPHRFDLAPPPAIAFLAAQRDAAPGGPFRVLGELDALKPNLGALYGLADPRGNDPMQPARAAYVVGRSLRARYEVGRQVWFAPSFVRQPVLDFLAVRFLLMRRRDRLPPPWEPVWKGTGSRIWRNPAAASLFFVPAAVEPAADPAAAALAAPDLKTVAFVGFGSPLPSRQEGRVRLLRTDPNGFELEVASPTGALVASSVSWVRGWRARLERIEGGGGGPSGGTAERGQAESGAERGEVAREGPSGGGTRLREIDGGFLGIVVPPGRHRLSVAFEPPHWRLGLALCGLGVALGLALAVRLAARAPAAPAQPSRRTISSVRSSG